MLRLVLIAVLAVANGWLATVALVRLVHGDVLIAAVLGCTVVALHVGIVRINRALSRASGRIA